MAAVGCLRRLEQDGSSELLMKSGAGDTVVSRISLCLDCSSAIDVRTRNRRSLVRVFVFVTMVTMQYQAAVSQVKWIDR